MKRQYLRGTPEQRFWPKVQKTDGCWLWIANKNNRGYGLFSMPGARAVSAHRFSYELANGPIPDGLFVCHHCDTPACVNPAHLFLGTNRDNMMDAMRKGRLVLPPGTGAVLREDGLCSAGHRLTAANIYRRPSREGRIVCRECRRLAARETEQRRPHRDRPDKRKGFQRESRSASWQG